ncbi:cytochrome c [Flavobacterium pectinovorum]|uniref:cytochrome c n=1 Tax=Flavobacterium pectinovorum TaxID=29533 RepID=UPI001FACDC0D|nr:cytochrome c [Flavobacterium pectinovorum]MCI9845852.1 cytochrome c [Flavobacterium pectinovorum]
MKLRILTVTAAILLLISCGTKKTASTAPQASAAPTVTETVKATELTPELAEGKSLYENSCARCHKLYEPKKFTQEEWKPILVSMQKKAKLDDIKMASITNYIHSQL